MACDHEGVSRDLAVSVAHLLAEISVMVGGLYYVHHQFLIFDKLFLVGRVSLTNTKSRISLKRLHSLRASFLYNPIPL